MRGAKRNYHRLTDECDVELIDSDGEEEVGGAERGEFGTSFAHSSGEQVEEDTEQPNNKHIPFAEQEDEEAVSFAQSSNSNSSTHRRPTTAKTKMDNDPISMMRARFRIKDPLIVGTLSEFYITFILFLIGTGITMQLVLGGGQLNNFMQLMLCWGLLVSCCLWCTMYSSGCHMNPVITIVFASLHRTPYHFVVPYIVAQFTGAFLGMNGAFYIYKDALMKHTGGELTIFGPKATAGIFTSFPAEHISNTTSFLESVACTGFLVLMVVALTDPRNRIPINYLPLGIGAVLFTVGSAYSMNAGGVLNPVGNLAGRVFCYCVGYGWDVFSWHGYQFWIPVIAPFFGGFIGCWSYCLFVAIHLPDLPDEIADEAERKESQSPMQPKLSSLMKQPPPLPPLLRAAGLMGSSKYHSDMDPLRNYAEHEDP